ncbi:YHYH protein [Haloferula sp. BvORR071]|uniref:YHYH protein n=1 Tax=Haloferula sp. BvORR071 TaxID=1396141 RepID=UPI000551B3B3|nr:YHYH protein [Haloferula sp. BvORR071]
MKAASLLSFLFLATANADPHISSWFTARSGAYARVYTSTANQSSGTTSATWSRGQGAQTTPTYAGVNEISYSNDWVYIRTTGLAGHVMGPWYLDSGKSQDFPNFPANTATLYRIPRNPKEATPTKTSTDLGASGYYVNGVAMFDMRDSFSYRNASAQDATPVNGLSGDGIWNREAYHNESVTFDNGYAHQAGKVYHYHAQPPGLRYQLGDHVSYDAATNVYSEMPGLPAKHSPILAWAADGFPVYGPYGYSDPNDPSSGIRRMTSGFRLRTITTRTALPAWSQRVQNRLTALTSSQYGPAVNGTYALGHYLEDYEYLGDVGFTHGVDFDLNEQNVRFCKTPEYPDGTWAYFLTITSTGTPVFPFSTGRQYYGTVSGGAVPSISEAVTSYWKGGPNKEEEPDVIAVSPNSGDVTLTWSAVEGGTYEVKAGDTPDGGVLATTPLTGSDKFTYTDSGAKTSHSKRFYRINRSALASFDSNGFNYTPPGGGGGSTVSFTFSFPTAPPIPPQDAVTSITVGGVATSITSYTQGTGSATVSFNNSTLASGMPYPAILSFTPPGQTLRTVNSSNTYTK